MKRTERNRIMVTEGGYHWVIRAEKVRLGKSGVVKKLWTGQGGQRLRRGWWIDDYDEVIMDH